MHSAIMSWTVGVSFLLLLLACGGAGGVMGPSIDQHGNAMWQDAAGRQTIWEAETSNTWFAKNGRIIYGLDPSGKFHAVDVSGQAIPLPIAPPQLQAWPGASTPLPGFEQVARARGLTLQSDAQQVVDERSIRVMFQMQQLQHETTMAIINDMSPQPTDFYENGVYIGTW